MPALLKNTHLMRVRRNRKSRREKIILCVGSGFTYIVVDKKKVKPKFPYCTSWRAVNGAHKENISINILKNILIAI